jgi:hypothetical protein
MQHLPFGQNGIMMALYCDRRFLDVAGGWEVGTSIESLFFWIRLHIQEVNTWHKQGTFYWLVKINRPHILKSMRRDSNLVVSQKLGSIYPRTLQLVSTDNEWRLIENGDKVRMGINSRYLVDLIDHNQSPDPDDLYVRIAMPVIEGATVDLLLPATPVDQTSFDVEFQFGRTKALAQSDNFWAQIPPTAARVDTPESLINETIWHNLKFVELLALKLPQKDLYPGEYSQISGSWHYEQLWPTPTSMTHIMLLDILGYHSISEKYLEVFKSNQGVRTPPGDFFGQHHGYFSAPESMAAIDWLSDHGAILHAIANHALLTDDQTFIQNWTESIIDACEFIRDSIAKTDHGGVKGIMPPAVANDRGDLVQAVWNDGWNYKGLTTAVRLLQRIGHPRAKEFSTIAATYKSAHNQAFRAAAQTTDQWTDKMSEQRHYVPTFLSGENTKVLPEQGPDPVTFYNDPFYLDTGPMFLVYAGLMDAIDPLMSESVSFFRNGPNEFVDGSCQFPPSLSFKLSENSQTLEISFEPQFRNNQTPEEIILHTPPLGSIQKVIINGETHSIEPGSFLLIQ